MQPVPTTEERSYFDFEPARALAAFTIFGAIVLTALGFAFKWTGDATRVIDGVFAGFCAFVGAFIVRGKVTANPNVALTMTEKKKLEDAGFVATVPSEIPPTDGGQIANGPVWTVAGILLCIALVVWLVRFV